MKRSVGWFDIVGWVVLVGAGSLFAGCLPDPTPCARTPACCAEPNGYFTRPDPGKWLEGPLKENKNVTLFAMADSIVSWVSDTSSPTKQLTYGRYIAVTNATGRLTVCEGTVDYWQSSYTLSQGFRSIDASPRIREVDERVYFAMEDTVLGFFETDFKGTDAILDLRPYKGTLVDVAVDPGGSGAVAWADTAGGIYLCTDARCTAPPTVIAVPGLTEPGQQHFYRRPRLSGSRVVFEDVTAGTVVLAETTTRPPTYRTIDTLASWPDIRDSLIVYSKAHDIPSCDWQRTPHNQIWAAYVNSTAPPFAILQAPHWGDNHAYSPRITENFVFYLNDQIAGKRIVMAYLRRDLGKAGVGYEISESLDPDVATNLAPVERNGMLFFPFRHATPQGDGYLSCSIVP